MMVLKWYRIHPTGSIRQPASWTGTVGLKPTYGRVSRYGLLAYGSSTDCVGPITTTVTDTALLLSAIAGPDALHDATASVDPVPDYLAALRDVEERIKSGEKPLKGLKIGLIKETMETRVEVCI